VKSVLCANILKQLFIRQVLSHLTRRRRRRKEEEEEEKRK
jgi:hypothetical protein